MPADATSPSLRRLIFSTLTCLCQERAVSGAGERPQSQSKACDAALNQIESTTLSHRSPQGPTPKAPALNQKNAGWPGRIFHAMAEYFQNCQKTDASLHKYIMCSSVSCAIQCCSGFCQICQKGRYRSGSWTPARSQSLRKAVRTCTTRA